MDSLQPSKTIHITMSPDSIDAKIEYGSVDSNYLDNETRRVYLYGQAYVRYKDLSLKADYIVVDLDSSIATAEGRLDSAGQLVGKPEFSMGDETFNAEKMRYNFQSRRGFIYNVVTTERDLFILGEQTKLVSGGSEPGQEDDVLYNKGALITTCNAPHPHFGIRASKVKTVPDKLAVVGASHLEIFGVPTPVWLPFGFYPISATRTAGVIVPSDYERSENWGFGIKDFGYYFPVKDWAEVRLLADIYFNGSWGTSIHTNYVRKYKYRGSINLGYSNRINELSNSYKTNVDKSFSIQWSHSQDSKANPYQTVGGSINIQSNNYQSLNYNDAQSALTNTYSSNFNYSRTFPDKPYSFTAGFNHSQNTNSHIVTINAPQLDFRLNRIYPFKSKTRPGPDQWYEKIAFQYSGTGRAQLIGTDTLLFQKETWDNAQWGIQHKASANVNFSAFKYFNFTPSIDYGETWFTKTREYDYNFDANDTNFVRIDTIFRPDSSYILQPDTISYGKVESSLDPGFETFRSISASMSMNTQIFNTIQFGKGWLRGIRHVIKPGIGFSYTPKSPEGYYQESKFSELFPDSTQLYNRFDRLMYSVQPIDIDRANINYSITNLFEAKYFSKGDSTEKKLKLFDNINLSGSYNIAADSFRFSPLNINGNTRFFKGITTVTIGATYSYYGRFDNGKLDKNLYINTSNKLLRFENSRVRISTGITLKQVLDFINGRKDDGSPKKGTIKPGPGSNKLPERGDKLFDLLNLFRISHEFGVTRMWMSGPDTTFITTNNLRMEGRFQMTPNWGVRIGNIGYDFLSKTLTYPDIGLIRDLHCWELSFDFQPERNTYSFHLGVKPGSFDFLKWSTNRGNYDTFGF